ncbi:FCS-Like Zinc finger 8-like [Tasmannia lanceolata]|uniref:FCS-Like Zinc finger 8-like n=1 Tax=Tasmannia lanceolata TaxID=3420 RepID=UPI0040630104
MLRKRSRSNHKDQNKSHLMSDSISDAHVSSDSFSVQKNRTRPFFSVPIGFSSKTLLDSDSANSPTSPLDCKGFSRPNGPHKSWDCNRVGLGIVDSLNDESKPKILGFSESRSILFGSQLRINIPNSQNSQQNSLDSSECSKIFPKNCAILPPNQITSPFPQPNCPGLGSNLTLKLEGIGKIQSFLSDCGGLPSPLTSLTNSNPKLNSDNFCSDSENTQVGSFQFVGDPNFEKFSGLKSNSVPISTGSVHGFLGSISASEIELSEDYTCVISHGPNPKTTHIFGDCILESHSIELDDCNKKEEWGIGSPPPMKLSGDCMSYPSDEFLSFCYSCKKKLEEGKDIYIYRGEKAFCSSSCRSQEILVDEEMENPTTNFSQSPKSTCCEDIFLIGMAVAE